MATAEQIREEVTKQVIDSIDTGTIPWRQPWQTGKNVGLPSNFHSHRRYTGINTMILVGTAMKYEYHCRHWGSASAVLSHIGAHVRKGQKATHVTFFRIIPRRDEKGAIEKDAKGNDKVIPLMRYFPVFNLEQFQAPTVETLLDGRGKFSLVKTLLGDESKTNRTQITKLEELRQIAHSYLPRDKQPAADATREQLATMIREGIETRLKFYTDTEVQVNQDPNYEPAELLLEKSGAKIRHGGGKACYRPSTDTINLPGKRSFRSITDYYQTAFHELAHWSLVDTRLSLKQSFETDTETYAFEELVAELASCYTLMELQVPLADTMLPKSQAYLKHWLSAMKADSKFLFTASTVAGKVTDYLLSFVGKSNPVFDETDDPERSVA